MHNPFKIEMAQFEITLDSPSDVKYTAAEKWITENLLVSPEITSNCFTLELDELGHINVIAVNRQFIKITIYELPPSWIKLDFASKKRGRTRQRCDVIFRPKSKAPLKNLIGLPDEILGNLDISYLTLDNFDGMPTKVTGKIIMFGIKANNAYGICHPVEKLGATPECLDAIPGFKIIRMLSHLNRSSTQ